MAKALDTYQCSRAVANAARLYQDGYRAIGLYYFHHSGFKELLTRGVAKALSDAGLYVWAFWEDGQPTSAAYFGTAQGALDGARAAACGLAAGQPLTTPVYATYDYDVAEGDLAAVTAYARAFRDALAVHGYTAGAYGNGLVCAHLKGAGLVAKTCLSESRGFAGYADWKPHCDILQSVGGTVHGIDYDADETMPSGGGGWKVS